MTAQIYDQKNNKVDTIDLPERIFGMRWNPDLIHQVLTAQIANNRQSLAHTKDRGEVRGGGRKPWRQKHTGRARHGSIRSPLWAGGGVTFGPRKERKFDKKINKKMKQQALFSILSKKLAGAEIKILDVLNLKDHKTKNFLSILKAFAGTKTTILITVLKINRNVFLAGRNAPMLKVVEPTSLNIYDCLKYQYIFFDKEAINKLIKHYKNSK